MPTGDNERTAKIMAAKADQRKDYAYPIEYFVDKVRAIESAGLNLSLKSENPLEGGVWFRIHHGMSFRSYGEKITVSINRSDNGASVYILSECGLPTQVVDYGKNRSNVEAIFNYLESGMGSACQVQQPAYSAPVQQPVYAAPVQDAPRFCTKCGAPTAPNDAFCARCGNKL